MNQEIPGWMSERDLEILSYISSCVPNHGNILELGPFLGRSTSALVHGKKDTVRLDVVDTFTGIAVNAECRDIGGNRELFNSMRALAIETGDWEQSFRQCQRDNLEKINVFKCSSNEFKIEKNYDFSFIDANHTFANVYFDINKFINHTGVILGDDYVPWWPEVVRAVNRFCLENNKTLIVPKGSKIWILLPENDYWKQCVYNII